MNDRAESLVYDIIHIIEELGRRRKVLNLYRHKFESLALEVILDKRYDVSDGGVSPGQLGEGFVRFIERVLGWLVGKGLGVREDSAELDELEKFAGAVGCVVAAVAEGLRGRQDTHVDDAVECGGRGRYARAGCCDGGAARRS